MCIVRILEVHFSRTLSQKGHAVERLPAAHILVAMVMTPGDA